MPSSVDYNSSQTQVPTFYILQPPAQLQQDLEACEQLCAGRPLSASTSAAVEEESGGGGSGDEGLRERIEEACGAELDYASSYPEVSRRRSLIFAEQELISAVQDWPFVMRQTDQFALQLIIAVRLSTIAQANPTTAETADFLFLSLDTRAVARCLTTCRHRDDFPPSLDRAEIKSQVREWIIDVVQSYRGRRPYPSLVLSLALIDHDYESNLLSMEMQEALKEEVVVLGIERAPWETEDLLSAFEQMPYPSTMHLPLRREGQQMELSGLGGWQLNQDRNYL